LSEEPLKTCGEFEFVKVVDGSGDAL